MAKEPMQQTTGKSLDEIAALMVANREAMMKGRQPKEVTVEDEEEVDAEEGVIEEESVAGEEEEEVFEDDDADTSDDADEEAETDDYDFGEIDEDTLFEFEGVDRPISLKELQQVYLADDTIAAKVQETEAAHQEVMETRNNALRDSEMFRSSMTEVIKALDSVLTQPLVSKPDPAMKQANPAGYIQHLEAYEQDQERIAMSRKAVLDALDGHSQKHKEFLEQRKAYEISRLAEKLPDLRVDGKKQEVFLDIADSASYYGFSKEELNNAAADHRLFHMARDAALYRKMKGQGTMTETGEEKLETLKKKVSSGSRVLRSKGTTASRRASASQKQVKVVKSRAQTTGKPSDVAAFLTARRSAT